MKKWMTPLLKAVVAFASLFLMSQNVGFRAVMANPFINGVLALFCGLLPWGGGYFCMRSGASDSSVCSFHRNCNRRCRYSYFNVSDLLCISPGKQRAFAAGARVVLFESPLYHSYLRGALLRYDVCYTGKLWRYFKLYPAFCADKCLFA